MGVLFSFGFAELHDYWILKLLYRSSFLKETGHFVFSRICGLHQPHQKSFSDLLIVLVSFAGASTGLTTGFISSSHVEKLTGNLYKILRPVSSFLYA
jgi:hypothetical protein